MYDAVKKAMKDYYDQSSMYDQSREEDARCEAYRIRQRIYQEMDEFYTANPEISPALLKSRIHTLIAGYFEPVIFKGNPFFFEMGLRERKSWGMSNLSPASWMQQVYRKHVLEQHPIVEKLEQEYLPLYDWSKIGLCSIPSSFDTDHHTLGYTDLFAVGINGVLKKLQDKKATCPEGSDAYDFCKAVEESCHALIAVVEKFAKRAEEMMVDCCEEKQLKYLKMIKETAGKIPANPPETFYEGLAMLLFTREVIATMENIGISQLGHLDRLLGDLYENDLREGRLTEEEARELLGIWMMYTDIKFDLENNEWPETSTCIQLGGCDEDGSSIYNQVTRMVIEEHHKLGLINPKLNCRYSSQSQEEYLKVMGRAMIAGHNNFVLINDEIVIPGLMKNGVEIEDARRFVSGGCQETMIEGCGHTEGAALYVSVPKILDLFLNGNENVTIVKTFGEPNSFEEFYEQFLSAIRYFFNLKIDQRNVRQQFEKKHLCCPLFSATQRMCIENGKDYVEGGAKYNFSTIALVGLGTVTDSLYAIKSLVYDQKKLTLKEFCYILASDWEGQEVLRQTAIALPKYGHNHKDVDALANRFLDDVASHIRSKKNERGGNYIPSLFVYYYFEYFSRALRATADGRKAHDLISPGCAPSQLQCIRDMTVPVKSMQNVDFTACGGGSAVLDMKLPGSGNLNEDLFAAFIRACGKYKCPTLQPNIVSQEDLLDAKVHPERHKNLIVRISGLSAFFVALTPTMQDEIIERNIYQA